MAESLPLVEFNAKRQIFEEVASEAICNFCQIVPRKPPIYQTASGLIACSDCKSTSTSRMEFQRSLILEKLLIGLYFGESVSLSELFIYF